MSRAAQAYALFAATARLHAFGKCVDHLLACILRILQQLLLDLAATWIT